MLIYGDPIVLVEQGGQPLARLQGQDFSWCVDQVILNFRSTVPVVTSIIDPRPRLTIGISALASDVPQLDLPAPNSDREIVIVVQGGSAPPFRRPDIRVETLETTGVARSRNRVLELARTDFLLFADADSSVISDGVDSVCDYLDRNPEVGVVLCQSLDERGALRKHFASRIKRLSRWNSARAGTIELVVRCSAQQKADVWFDPKFGAGSQVQIGDEYIFITDLLAAGVVGRTLPIPVAVHPGQSSGHTMGLLDHRVAVLDRVFGKRFAWFARLMFVVRRPVRFGSVKATWSFLTRK